MDKKPTIKTIAQLAGVSHVTVSHALRGYPDISTSMTEKIRNIAKEIGYTPNAFARSLSSNRPSSIGMIVPAMGAETIYNEVFENISAKAAGKGLSVLLGSCGRNIELEKTFCRIMCENRVGALLVSPVGSDVSHIKEICEGIVPLIFIGGKTGVEEENCITADYRQSGNLAVEHLAILGHRDIALFVYEPNNMTIRHKIEGYETAMKSLGLTPRVFWQGDSSDTFSAGKSLAKRLIDKKELPTAIWCASDLMAIGVIDALIEHGINIPGEVSVVGHDDLFLSGISLISLTTMTLPKAEIGRHALDIALSLMDEGNASQPHRVTVRPELIVRGSSGPLK